MAKLKPPKHKILHIKIVTASCACGWSWRNPKLKGKSDTDLQLESWMAFKKHAGLE